MRKIIFIVMCVSIFSLYAENKKVKIVSVEGLVKYEVSEDTWEKVTKNTELKLSTKIKTGLNSSLVIKLSDDKVVKIKAMKKGTIDTLSSSKSAGMTGIKIGGTLTQSDVNADDVQERTNISTASTRASDAVEDLEWEEEE